MGMYSRIFVEKEVALKIENEGPYGDMLSPIRVSIHPPYLKSRWCLKDLWKVFRELMTG